MQTPAFIPPPLSLPPPLANAPGVYQTKKTLKTTFDLALSQTAFSRQDSIPNFRVLGKNRFMR